MGFSECHQLNPLYLEWILKPLPGQTVTNGAHGLLGHQRGLVTRRCIILGALF